MKKGILIAAFAGLGKTTLGKKYDNVIDLESSDFKWLETGLENIDKEKRKGLSSRNPNPDWPQNYINKIVEVQALYDIVLISVSSEIRQEYDKSGLKYLVAIPSPSSKNIIKNRLIQRGNSQEFIDGFEVRFDMIEKKFFEVENKIYVKENEYLEDSLKREGILN